MFTGERPCAGVSGLPVIREELVAGTADRFRYVGISTVRDFLMKCRLIVTSRLAENRGLQHLFVPLPEAGGGGGLRGARLGVVEALVLGHHHVDHGLRHSVGHPAAGQPGFYRAEVHRQPEVGSALPCRMPNGSDQEDGANWEGGEHTLAEDASQPRATAE